MRSTRMVASGIAIAVVPVLVLAFCQSRSFPFHINSQGEFPPALAQEVREIARDVATTHGLYLHAKGGSESSDGLERLSLWVLPSEDADLWTMVLSRHGTTLSVTASEMAGFPTKALDSLFHDMKSELEGQLGISLCQNAPRRCVLPADPDLLYLMDMGHVRAEEPGQFIYDLAARHGVRVLEVKIVKTEGADEVVGEGIFEALFYRDKRSLLRGEFPLILTNTPSGGRLVLSMFHRGGMYKDVQDALVQDAKSTFEAHYGGRFCRADPATERCDAEHAELERHREEWLQARVTGDVFEIEAFLAARPESPHARAAREHASRIRDLARHPPPVRPGPTAPWAGRHPGERFADALPDGSAGPEMTVAPAGVFRMGCADARSCPLEELPVHEVRVARPFALSTREVTHAQYFRFVRPEKRLDPTWSDRPATHLTWAEATMYAAWLSEQTSAAYRLPSEAEWEWAARANTATAYAWGDEMEGGRARCHECPWPQPSGLDRWGLPMRMPWVLPVASYPPNAWGFHDMHGNAAEWTADCWHRDHVGAPPDGAARMDGDCSRRVVRGGSYDTPPRALRSSARVGKDAGERYLDVGFRVLRELRNVEAWAE